MTHNWHWASANDGPAGDRFIIEDGQDALWRRVRSEISEGERCAWMRIHRAGKAVGLGDILDMMLTVVPLYRVSQNRFVFEAAKIPVFAKFLRSAPADLCNYVSNSCYPDHEAKPEPYSDATMRQLGRVVSHTLGCEDDWF